MNRGRAWTWAANLATSLNGVCGAGAISYVLLGNKLFAMFLILAGVGFDGLDGIFHRRSGEPSRAFGRVADSLSDGITFCLAPGFALAFDNYPLHLWTPYADLAYVVGASVAVVGIARLVYFTTVAYARPHFTGASTPQNAMLVVLLILIFQVPAFLGTQPLVVLLVALAFVPVMVLPIPYPKARRGSPLRPVTGAMAAFLSLSLVLVNFRPSPGTTVYDLSYSGAVVAFLLLLAFYVVGPIVASRKSPEPPSGGEDASPKELEEGDADQGE